MAEPCPACGRETLASIGEGEVCVLCGWADDPLARERWDWQDGVNGVSLAEAQANVARFGLAFPPSEAGGS